MFTFIAVVVALAVGFAAGALFYRKHAVELEAKLAEAEAKIKSITGRN
jgi:hypothetical protein